MRAHVLEANYSAISEEPAWASVWSFGSVSDCEVVINERKTNKGRRIGASVTSRPANDSRVPHDTRGQSRAHFAFSSRFNLRTVLAKWIVRGLCQKLYKFVP